LKGEFATSSSSRYLHRHSQNGFINTVTLTYHKTNPIPSTFFTCNELVSSSLSPLLLRSLSLSFTHTHTLTHPHTHTHTHTHTHIIIHALILCLSLCFSISTFSFFFCFRCLSLIICFFLRLFTFFCSHSFFSNYFVFFSFYCFSVTHSLFLFLFLWFLLFLSQCFCCLNLYPSAYLYFSFLLFVFTELFFFCYTSLPISMTSKSKRPTPTTCRSGDLKKLFQTLLYWWIRLLNIKYFGTTFFSNFDQKKQLKNLSFHSDRLVELMLETNYVWKVRCWLKLSALLKQKLIWWFYHIQYNLVLIDIFAI